LKIRHYLLAIPAQKIIKNRKTERKTGSNYAFTGASICYNDIFVASLYITATNLSYFYYFDNSLSLLPILYQNPKVKANFHAIQNSKRQNIFVLQATTSPLSAQFQKQGICGRAYQNPIVRATPGL